MKIIRDYYAQANLPELVLNSKLSLLEKHRDIAAEFTEWIQTGSYKTDGISEQGYTAQALAELSPVLDGEGAFTFLIQLRESPSKALKKLEKRDTYFKIK